MREVWPYLKAVGQVWWALMSCAVFTFLSLFAAATHQTEEWMFWSSVVASVVMWSIAGYVAWRKLYLQITSAPDVLIFWSSPDAKRPGRDEITFRVLGNQWALHVVVENFTPADFQWMRPLEIPALHPGEPRTFPADFSRWTGPNSSEVGYMRSVLVAQGLAKEGVCLSIRFRNVQGTTFRRKFVLRLLPLAGDYEIHCEPSSIEVLRKKRALLSSGPLRARGTST